MLFYGIGHDAHLVDGLFELLLRDAQRFSPIAQLMGFVDVDARSVGGAAVLEIVCHVMNIERVSRLRNWGSTARLGGVFASWPSHCEADGRLVTSWAMAEAVQALLRAEWRPTAKELPPTVGWLRKG